MKHKLISKVLALAFSLSVAVAMTSVSAFAAGESSLLGGLSAFLDPLSTINTFSEVVNNLTGSGTNITD